MSDFLSNFGAENYQKLQKGKLQAEPKMEQAKAKEEPKERERITDQAKPAAPKVTDNLALELPENAREELYILDPESKSRRKKRRILFALLAVSLAAIGVLYYQSKIVQLPDFISDYADKAEVWALKTMCL